MNTQKLVYAGRLDRILANLIDGIILFIPTGLAASVMSDSALLVPVVFLCELIYYTAFDGSNWQASPGKRLMNMYIIRLDGNRLSQTEALERFIAFVLPRLPTYVSFLSDNTATMVASLLTAMWFTPILMRDDRAGMHDSICNTRVVVGKVG